MYMENTFTQKHYSNDRILRLSRLFILFSLISIFGWILETVSQSIAYGELVDRGFMTLPFCTIYGGTLVLTYLVFKTPYEGMWQKLLYRSRNASRKAQTWSFVGILFLYAIVVAIAATVSELVTALFFDKVFGVLLWDYSNMPLNLFGYVCLPFSALWGVLITLAMTTAFPWLYIKINSFSNRTTYLLASIFFALIVGDLVFNFAYLNLHGKLFSPY